MMDHKKHIGIPGRREESSTPEVKVKTASIQYLYDGYNKSITLQCRPMCVGYGDIAV